MAQSAISPDNEVNLKMSELIQRHRYTAKGFIYFYSSIYIRMIVMNKIHLALL
jgi:hypothetical protein